MTSGLVRNEEQGNSANKIHFLSLAVVCDAMESAADMDEAGCVPCVEKIRVLTCINDGQ